MTLYPYKKFSILNKIVILSTVSFSIIYTIFSIFRKIQKYVAKNNFTQFNNNVCVYIDNIEDSISDNYSIILTSEFFKESSADISPICRLSQDCLEISLAHFLQTEDCMIFIDDFSTIFSTLLATSHNCQTLFLDSSISSTLKRSLVNYAHNIEYFPHNDSESLEKNIRRLVRRDSQYRLKPAIYVEVIYRDGSVCDIFAMIELRFKYNIILIIGEQRSVGSLGICGRGIMEEEKVPVSHVDIIIGNFQRICQTIGGFCAGNKTMINNFREMNQQYHLLSKLPAMIAEKISNCISILDSVEGEAMVFNLRKNSLKFHRGFIKHLSDYWTIEGYESNFVKHIFLKEVANSARISHFRTIILQKGIKVGISKNLSPEEKESGRDSIEIHIPYKMTEEDMEYVLTVFINTTQEMLHNKNLTLSS